MSSAADYFPMGAYNDKNAPYNQPDIPEKEFEVTCSQSLSKTVKITTNNYIPGDSGIDYEPDGEGGYYISGWQDDPDTSNTNWNKEYFYTHLTPIQLIQRFKEFLEIELEDMERNTYVINSPIRKMQRNNIKHLIEECSSWTEDETEVVLG